MPLICYEPKKFRAEALKIIERSNQIIAEYATQGYDLTLRQIYYQFVSRGWISNKDSEYKRLGTVISDARLAGLIDWNAITDRTRNLRGLTRWSNPQEIMAAIADQYHESWWDSQEFYVEVWVEKDALIGVVGRACEALDVPYFSCRGYTSQSEMWIAGRRLGDQMDLYEKKVVVIHLGDHDPSGLGMTEDVTRRLEMFADGSVEVNRIALNRDQVDLYRPPPNPAKMTDPRAAGYIKTYGRQSWELDALDPVVIDQLITETVSQYIDWDLFEERQAEEDQSRGVLNAIKDKWDQVGEYVENLLQEEGS